MTRRYNRTKPSKVYKEIDGVLHKICSKCKQLKPHTDFGKDSRRGRRGKRGVYPSCLTCEQMHRDNNRASIRESGRLSYQKNKERKRNYDRDYTRNRKKRDVEYRLKALLRTRLSQMLKKYKTIKTTSAIKLVGCDMQALRTHLEQQFQPGMTWENYGKYGWHIDHKQPISSFVVQEAEQLKACCHYTNLQPLWAKDNLSKGAKYDA